ncbi:pD345L [African swine fever virus]|uniref:PD345L n=1 Tax=African swine fever virus TaxID=10497 RepID=A0A894KR49_ASF|nr:pD345L [African swine fever virus]
MCKHICTIVDVLCGYRAVLCAANFFICLHGRWRGFITMYVMYELLYVGIFVFYKLGMFHIWNYLQDTDLPSKVPNHIWYFGTRGFIWHTILYTVLFFLVQRFKYLAKCFRVEHAKIYRCLGVLLCGADRVVSPGKREHGLWRVDINIGLIIPSQLLYAAHAKHGLDVHAHTDTRGKGKAGLYLWHILRGHRVFYFSVVWGFYFYQHGDAFRGFIPYIVTNCFVFPGLLCTVSQRYVSKPIGAITMPGVSQIRSINMYIVTYVGGLAEQFKYIFTITLKKGSPATSSAVQILLTKICFFRQGYILPFVWVYTYNATKVRAPHLCATSSMPGIGTLLWRVFIQAYKGF